MTLDLVALVGFATAYVWCGPFAADGDHDAAFTLSLFGGTAENPTLAGIVITPLEQPEEPSATSTATATATATPTASSTATLVPTVARTATRTPTLRPSPMRTPNCYRYLLDELPPMVI
jgi:hypothetical protein